MDVLAVAHISLYLATSHMIRHSIITTICELPEALGNNAGFDFFHRRFETARDGRASSVRNGLEGRQETIVIQCAGEAFFLQKVHKRCQGQGGCDQSLTATVHFTADRSYANLRRTFTFYLWLSHVHDYMIANSKCCSYYAAGHAPKGVSPLETSLNTLFDSLRGPSKAFEHRHWLTLV